MEKQDYEYNLNAEQIANKFKLSATTIRMLAKNNNIPHVRIKAGKKHMYRFSEQELKMFFKKEVL